MATVSPVSPTEATGSGKSMKVAMAAAVILIVGSGVFFLNRSANPKDQPNQTGTPQQTAPSVLSAESAIVYGVWERNNTVLHATTATAQGPLDAVIGRLPLDIKNIRPVSDTSFVYIAGVDRKDHGTSIVLYDALTQQQETVVTADAGWGIDNLIVSPDKQYLAYWQVQFSENTSILAGGASRVYTASLASLPATPYLVYDEAATGESIIHYPLFFDHTGRLYADGFSPNGDGWSRGLMRSDPMGNHKEEILSSGSYNSDPVLSPTENAITYTSYNPAQGFLLQGKGASGTASVEYLNPNTVKLLNLDTLVDRVLVSPGDRLYYDPTWKTDGTELFVRSYGADGTQLTQPALPLTVHLPAGTIETLDGGTIVDGMIVNFTADGIVTGVPAASGATGNLGSTYSPVLGGFALNHPDNTVTTIPAANAQYIHTTGAKLPDTIVYEPQSAGNESLQLATFVLKPQIETRPAQQNDVPPNVPVQDGRPQCKPLYEALKAQGGLGSTETTMTAPTFDPSLNVTVTVGEDPSLQLGQFAPRTAATQVVTGSIPSYKEMKPQLQQEYKCFDSPLYLYNARPLSVRVHVTNATILTSNPVYDEDRGWHVYATPHGSKIDYSYAAAFSRPDDGYVVSSSRLTAFLTLYAQRLGLNERETDDYVSFWSEKLPARDYYVVSHYPDPSLVMNMAITPTPDTFIQAVMYFKPITREEKPLYDSLPAPSFSPVPSRTGFTAVDWSGIVEGE